MQSRPMGSAHANSMHEAMRAATAKRRWTSVMPQSCAIITCMMDAETAYCTAAPAGSEV